MLLGLKLILQLLFPEDFHLDSKEDSLTDMLREFEMNGPTSLGVGLDDGLEKLKDFESQLADATLRRERQQTQTRRRELAQ